MIHSIESLLRDADVPRFDPSDESLSSGVRTHARIVAVLVEAWHVLDGRQQRALVDVLDASTRGSKEAESYAARRFGGDA